jgi:hypothetical protein
LLTYFLLLPLLVLVPPPLLLLLLPLPLDWHGRSRLCRSAQRVSKQCGRIIADLFTASAAAASAAALPCCAGAPSGCESSVGAPAPHTAV